MTVIVTLETVYIYKYIKQVCIFTEKNQSTVYNNIYCTIIKLSVQYKLNQLII
jgi:hypothetical protein